MIAVDTRRPVSYVLEADRPRPPEDQTTFDLRVLPVRQRPDVIRYAKRLQAAQPKLKAEDGNVDVGALSELIDALTGLCQLGLAGWSNLKGADGGVVKYEAGETALDVLDIHTISELASQIVNINTLQANERGN